MRKVIFEDPESGKIILVSDEVKVGDEFCLFKSCWNCPVNDKAEDSCVKSCTNWVLENPQEAGKLMGYRVVAVEGEEKKDNSEKNRNEDNESETQNVPSKEPQKPFLLQHLNVEPEQVFEIELEGETKEYKVNNEGWLMVENKGLLGGWLYAPVMTVYRVLDNPWLVKKRAKVTLEKEEIELLRRVLNLVPGVRFMGLSGSLNGVLFWNENQVVVLSMARMGRFPVLDKVKEVNVLEAVEQGWVREKKGN